MLQITDHAASHLQHLREEKGHDATVGVRLLRNSGRVGLTFVDKPEEGDKVVNRDELPIYVAPDIETTYANGVVDARTDGGRTWLVIHRRSKRAARTGANGTRRVARARA